MIHVNRYVKDSLTIGLSSATKSRKTPNVLKLVTRCSIIFLCVVLLFGSNLAYAGTTVSSSTSFSIVNAKGNSITVKPTSVTDPGNKQCWEYVNRLFKKVWGVRFDSSFKGTNKNGYNLLRNLSAEQRKLTADNAKKFISAAPLGASIRIQSCPTSCSHFNDDGLSCGHNGHSVFLVAKNASGFTVMERLTGEGAVTKKYTWDQFARERSSYKYFKYIKWPGAKDINQAETPFYGTYMFINDDESRFDPYENSPIINKYAKGSVVNVVASFVNESKNTWYKLDDGSYVYSGELGNKIESVERSYYKTNKNTVLYSSPTELSNTLAISKDIGVIITGKYTAGSQTWLGTADGYFIKNADVTYVEKAPAIGGFTTEDSSIRFKAKIKYTDGLYLEDEPYADAKNMVRVGYNEELSIKGLYKNKYQNYWVGVEKDGRLFYTCANNITFVSDDSSNDVTINGKNYAPNGIVTDGSLFPTGTKKKGAGFELRGTISSPYTIISAQGFVYSGDPINKKVDAQTSLVTINKTSFDLNTSNINIAKNGGIAFGKLSEGNKAFRLLVNYEKLVWHNITNEKECPISKQQCSKSFYSVFSIGSNNDNNPFTDISDNVKVTGITLDKSSITIDKGQSYTLKATIAPSNATNKNVTWSSNNQAVATVDGNGTVKAVASGTATITVTTADGGKTAICTVTVQVYNTLEFRNVTCPVNYKIGSSGGYVLSGGTLVSNEELKSITSTIKKSDGTVISGPKTRNISGRSYNIKSLDTMESSDNGVHFSWIKTAGNYIWVLTATDVSKTLTLEMPFTASSSATSSQNVTKTYTISVTGVALDKTDITLTPGSTTILAVTVLPDNAANKNVTWSSNNQAVATVDGNGIVTAIAPGTATITVITTDGGKAATCTVTVPAAPIEPVYVTGVTLNKTSLTLKEKETETLSATVIPFNAYNQKTTWSSSNSNVAKVDMNGKVTAIKAGQATITVATEDGGKTATCTVTVAAPVAVTSVKLNKTSVQITEGETLTLAATIAPTNAANQKVAWSSSDNKVAKVDTKGKVTAVKYGKATITVTTEDGKKTATCTVTVDPADKVAAFVVRCYRIILGREADEGGMKTWLNELNSGRKAASEIIDRFVNSPEFQNKKYTNAEAVDILYKAMLNRNADPKGREHWVDKLKTQPFGAVINGFCFSEEFRGLCKSYGIRAGFVELPNNDTTTTGKIKAFVQRCYRLILDREADPSGMETWSKQLSSGNRAAAEIIDEFVSSKEFKGKKYSDSESVEILYKAMLGRGSDAEGKDNWLKKLKNGQTLVDVINGFCKSKEFTGICNAYGIKPGTVLKKLSGQTEEELSMLALNAKAPITKKSETNPTRVEIINPSDTIDLNIGTAVQAVYINEEKAKEFISRCYQCILGREASAAELDNWIGQMTNGTKTPDQIARGFLFSNEFKGKNVSNEDMVKILYKVYMNRDADPEGLKTWMEKLDGGTELKALLDAFAKTSEFKKVVNEMSK